MVSRKYIRKIFFLRKGIKFLKINIKMNIFFCEKMLCMVDIVCVGTYAWWLGAEASPGARCGSYVQSWTGRFNIWVDFRYG